MEVYLPISFVVIATVIIVALIIFALKDMHS